MNTQETNTLFETEYSINELDTLSISTTEQDDSANFDSIDIPTSFDDIFALDVDTTGAKSPVHDALVYSLSNLGRVDIEYISEISDTDMKTVIKELGDSVYQNPETWNNCYYMGWETADEYLSGNLIRKFRAADKANKKHHGYFQRNLEALERIIPPAVAKEDIYITLGSPWVPTDIIDDFIDHLIGPEIKNLSKSVYRTRHSTELGTWEIPGKTRYDRSRYRTRCYITYGTSRLDALSIIEKTLNQKTIAIYDESQVPNPSKPGKMKKIRVLNEKETLLAIEKQDAILEEFGKWIWDNPDRAQRLQFIYEERYSANKVRHFDGSFLAIPNLNPDITLYPYQKNAIARILLTPNTLLAHDVGSGKTYIMICAGMELRRMGIAKKNMYVVPNNLVGQWRDTFKSLYKDANILVIEPRSFTPAKRWDTLAKVRDGDYDGIIIAYSCFENIPLSKKFVIEKLEDEIMSIEKSSQELYSNIYSKQRQKLEKELNEKILTRVNPEEVSFDKLGINTIFLDEAHNYKNVPVFTKVDRVLGISSGGSAKCQDMLDKIMHVQKTNNGRGAVLATGTPITNSITDAYTMQRYLQNGELKLLGLSSFDGWIGMFAEKHTEFEIDVDTSTYRLATRFSRFHNLPELTSLFASVADFHAVTPNEAEIPTLNGYTDVTLEADYHFKKYLKEISKRAEKIRKGKVKRKHDNMLLLTTDGRKAALDIRLISRSILPLALTKVEKCANNIMKLYKSYQGTTQLVFCDYSTPKAEFNLYDELKLLLVNKGVPENEIEFVHNANTERKRDKLFEKVRKGEIRVLIGSTFKLGLGVNVQDKLIAIHHLDVPWRPADMVQREGRILRQGNTNEQVFIFRYITRGSFDAYTWQLLETKQRFISSLLSGYLNQRSGSDVSDVVLNYAEVKSLAVGDPKMKERVEIANELDRLIIIQRESLHRREQLTSELKSIPDMLEKQEIYLERAKKDKRLYANEQKELPMEERRALRQALEAAILENDFSTEERELFEYQGFKIVLPAGMSSRKPFIWLYGNGKYYLELGDSPFGYLIRIDNFLKEFSEHVKKLKKNIETLKSNQTSMEEELSKSDSYSDKIESLTRKLAKIDKELGVNVE